MKIERKKERKKTYRLNWLTIYIFINFVFIMSFAKKVLPDIKQKIQNSIFLKTPQLITNQTIFNTVTSLAFSKALHINDKFVHMFQNWYIW